MKNKLIFLDTETTGKDTEDRLIEVAYRVQEEKEGHSLFFKPPLPIKLEAMMVHHITEKMVKDRIPFKGGGFQKRLQRFFDEGYILVAHNAEFDVNMLEKEGMKIPNYICTMKVARHLDEKDEIKSYKVQYLRYLWGIEADAYAHSAAGDIHVLEKVFEVLEKKMSIDEMLKVTREPFLLRSLTFGKHKGKPFKTIPTDYLMWLRKQPDIKGDLLFTLNHYINNRQSW